VYGVAHSLSLFPSHAGRAAWLRPSSWGRIRRGGLRPGLDLGVAVINDNRPLDRAKLSPRILAEAATAFDLTSEQPLAGDFGTFDQS
jgi:hypothetical protein